MTPTAKLRWVIRPVPFPISGHPDTRVLQQWWGIQLADIKGDTTHEYGEWRDIPVEGEA